MISTDSRFDTEFARVYNPNLPDRGLSAPFSGYTAQENRGKQLYLLPPNQGGAGCVSCHSAPTFALAANSRSNGLDAGETVVFKSPSLKNVALTGPYMHDGRFQSLEQVVDHYIRGVQNGPALDNRLRNGAGQPLRLNLTVTDRDALVAFLRTLNDTTLTTDPKFSTPFRN
jgi:cytochrome c peroxidase